MTTLTLDAHKPVTASLQQAIAGFADGRAVNDLLFLERWELSPLPGSATAMRVNQIRRANPILAAAIRREIADTSRAKLSAGV